MSNRSISHLKRRHTATLLWRLRQQERAIFWGGRSQQGPDKPPEMSPSEIRDFSKVKRAPLSAEEQAQQMLQQSLTLQKMLTGAALSVRVRSAGAMIMPPLPSYEYPFSCSKLNKKIGRTYFGVRKPSTKYFQGQSTACHREGHNVRHWDLSSVKDYLPCTITKWDSYRTFAVQQL